MHRCGMAEPHAWRTGECLGWLDHDSGPAAANRPEHDGAKELGLQQGVFCILNPDGTRLEKMLATQLNAGHASFARDALVGSSPCMAAVLLGTMIVTMVSILVRRHAS